MRSRIRHRDRPGFRSRVVAFAVAVVMLAWQGAAVAAPWSPVEARWRDRLLFVFAAPEHARWLEAWRDAAKRHACRIAERDLRVLHVGERGVTDLVTGMPVETDPGDLARRYGAVAGAFGVVLVGKDGGVKLAGDTETTFGEIVQRIDGMPMRRAEAAATPSACDHEDPA